MNFSRMWPGNWLRKPLSTIMMTSMVITFLHFLMLLTGSIWFEPEQPGTLAVTQQDSAKVILANESPMWARRWYHWDSLWFVHLSRFGYRVEQFADGSLAQ